MTLHPELLDSETSVLLIVDIQTKLVRAMPDNAAEAMLKNTCHLIEAANLFNIPILFTEQYPKGLGPTVESLAAKLNSDAIRIEKTAFSCCAADNFNDILKGTSRNQIVIVGQETHVCILQTALDLLQQGYQVHILEDAVCSRKAEHKRYALQRMQQHGMTISNSESVLFEWLKHARHEHFSAISQLLR